MLWERFFRGPLMELHLDDGSEDARGGGGRRTAKSTDAADDKAGGEPDGGDPDDDDDRVYDGIGERPTKGADKGGDKGGGKGKGKASEEESEIDRLRRENRELRESERHWAERAARVAEGEDDPESDDEPEPKDPVETDEEPAKLIEDVTKHGAKALAKRGFLTVAQAKKLFTEVAHEVASKTVAQSERRMGIDAQMFGEYPDLRDKDSALFKKTSVIFQDLVKTSADPRAAAHSPALLRAAARAAKAELKAESGGSRPRRDADDGDDYVDDAELGRRARVRAQQGERGGSMGGDDDFADVGPGTRSIMEAMGLSKEQQARAAKRIGANRRERRAG